MAAVTIHSDFGAQENKSLCYYYMELLMSTPVVMDTFFKKTNDTLILSPLFMAQTGSYIPWGAESWTT